MTLTISSTALSLAIDEQTGCLVSVRNLRRDLDLIAAPPDAPPFRLELDEIGWVQDYTHHTQQRLGDGLRLTWETAYDVTIVSTVMIRGEDIVLTVRAQN